MPCGRVFRCWIGFGLALGLLLAAGQAESASVSEAPSAGAYGKQVKMWLQAHLAEPVALRHAETDPVFVWIAGWDFQDQRWKLNEFTNQMTHMLVGGMTTRLMGRHVSLLLAVGLELGQYFGHDRRALKLPDRIRDVCFYLLP